MATEIDSIHIYGGGIRCAHCAGTGVIETAQRVLIANVFVKTSRKCNACYYGEVGL